jgi:hypothetical protein
MIYDTIDIEFDDIDDKMKFVFYPEMRCSDLEGCADCLAPKAYTVTGIAHVNLTRCGWCSSENRCLSRIVDQTLVQSSECGITMRVDDTRVCDSLKDDSGGPCGRRNGCEA